MSRSSLYWKNQFIKVGNACPNVSLFRLLNELKFVFNKKKVLELGFGHGADIIEFKKRGADVYGIDINKNAVKDKRSYQVNFSLFKRLAPKHAPKVDLVEAIKNINQGLVAIKFNDPNFRQSNLIRLNVLRYHIKHKSLDKNLEWLS